MHLNEYQVRAAEFAQYEDIGGPLVYASLGLAGEAGEFVEKVKKLHRNHGGELNEERAQELAKELGDTLWYISDLAHRLGFTLSQIANLNLEKLISRKERGVINSQGDNR